MYLRQATASQEILLGRFVDNNDGDTEETGLSIANTDIKIWKEGGTTLASKNSGGATHIANGLYYCVLDATDTDTLGKLEVHVHKSGALAVKREFMVMSGDVYDAMFGTIAEPTEVFGWPTSWPAIIAWLGVAATGAYVETASQAKFRDRADTTDLATAALSDDTTSFERGPVT